MMMMNEELMSTDCWTELPFDLLSLIFNKVMSFSLSDYVRISAVCPQWRSFFITENYEHIKLPSKLPVLLIPSTTTTTTTHSTESIEDMTNNHHHHHHHQQQQQEKEEEKNQEGVFMVDLHDYYNPREICLGLNQKQRHQNTRSFYSISEKKVYDFQLPIPSYLNCRGSSHGWLVVVDECSDGTYPVHLLNPFRSDNNNNNKIHLPPLTSCEPYKPVYNSYSLDKAILSTDPSSHILSNPTTTTTTTDDELVVLGLFGATNVRFCRPGDKAWTPMHGLSYGPFLCNLICYRGQFWLILENGRAVAFDISPLLPEPNVTTIIDPSQDDDDPHSLCRYLVESAGNLFQVRRDVLWNQYNADDYRCSTVGFYVFKLDWASMEWVKTNSLDGHMFFLGGNASISVSASDYFFSTGGGSFKPNSIYFTDYFNHGHGRTSGTVGPDDMGVFNLDDGSFEHFEPYYTLGSRHTMPAPFWIQPML